MPRNTANREHILPKLPDTEKSTKMGTKTAKNPDNLQYYGWHKVNKMSEICPDLPYYGWQEVAKISVFDIWRQLSTAIICQYLPKFSHIYHTMFNIKWIKWKNLSKIYPTLVDKKMTKCQKVQYDGNCPSIGRQLPSYCTFFDNFCHMMAIAHL